MLVAGTSFLSHLLKVPEKSKKEFIEQALVFNNRELEDINQLTLKNKSGEYSFIKEEIWHMTSPKAMSSNSLFIANLFSALNTIKTKKLFLDDQNNNSNFSLINPTATITLSNSSGKNILISIGIMNAIDNSTYIKILGKDGIFHVEAPSISLENISLADLTTSSIFDFDLKKITALQIFKKNIKISEIKKISGVWSNHDNKELAPPRAEEILQNFLNLKSSFILEEQNDYQKKIISPLISSGEYSLKIFIEDKETLSYKISAITTKIAGLALNDEPYFVITENHAAIAYVVKKEFLSIFQQVF